MKNKRRQGRVNDGDINPKFDDFDSKTNDYHTAWYSMESRTRSPPSPPPPPSYSNEKEQKMDRSSSVGIVICVFSDLDFICK